MRDATSSDRLEQLRAVLDTGEGDAAILVHDYPDPDCLASAMGLQRLFDHWSIPSRIVHGGGMGRAENKAMVGLLNLQLSLIDEIDQASFRGAVLVDTQPSTGNNSLPDDLPVLAVIDHHPLLEDECADVPYVDVRPEMSASSSIVHQYLGTAGIAIEGILATALYLGIRTDTDSLEREASREDVESYVRLLPVVDLELVAKITHPPLPDEYFGYLDRALTDACRFGEAVVANVGPLDTPDFLSAISDMLIQSKGSAWALAVGWHENTIYLSLRIRPPRKNAANILRKTVAEYGRGGGHGLAAGGQIHVGTGDDLETTASDTIRRFLEAVGAHDDTGRPLSVKISHAPVPPTLELFSSSAKSREIRDGE